MEAIIKEIKGLSISNETARIIEALKNIKQIEEEIYSVMTDLFGEGEAIELRQTFLINGYESLYDGIEKCLYMSISENLISGNFTKI